MAPIASTTFFLLSGPLFCRPGERYFVLPGDSPLFSRVTRPRPPGQHVHVLGRAKSYPPYPCLCVKWHLVFPARLSFVHKNSFRFPFPVSFVPLRQGAKRSEATEGYVGFPI